MQIFSEPEALQAQQLLSEIDILISFMAKYSCRNVNFRELQRSPAKGQTCLRIGYKWGIIHFQDPSPQRFSEIHMHFLKNPLLVVVRV